MWGVLAALTSFSHSALAGDKPSAVQVCLTMPEVAPLFADHAGPGYRPLGDGVFVVDLELTLNGRAPERLTKMSRDCLRAWLPAQPVRQVAVNFERTTLNLTPVTKAVDLQLKPDLWYDAGRLTVSQRPWVEVVSELPGHLAFERQGPQGQSEWPQWSKLAEGQYRVTYEAPADSKRCTVKVKASATGSVREDNQPALVAELVETYRTEWLPDVLAEHKVSCHAGEGVEVEVRLVDGVYFKPREPQFRKVSLPAEAPTYAVTVDGNLTPFTSGQVVRLLAGQHARFSEVAHAAQATASTD